MTLHEAATIAMRELGWTEERIEAAHAHAFLKDGYTKVAEALVPENSERVFIENLKQQCIRLTDSN